MRSNSLVSILISVVTTLSSVIAFAEQGKPITSWNDIVIGKTTEDEIILQNSGGSVSLSFREWTKAKQGQSGLRRLTYGTECSYAEEKNKIDEQSSWAIKNGMEKDTADWLSGQKDNKSYFQENFGLIPEEKGTTLRTDVQKLDDCLKPELLNSGPISLKWNKLERAELEILSDGVVLGWRMQYWLGDLKKRDGIDMESSVLVSRNEMLNLLESALGSPGKKVQSDKKTESYNFLIGSRKINVHLIYLDDGSVRFVEIGEQTEKPTESMREETTDAGVWLINKLF